MKSEAPRLNGAEAHEDARSEPISEKIAISLPPAMLERIQDYRFSNRMNSLSSAVRNLIELGLISAGQKKPNSLI